METKNTPAIQELPEGSVPAPYRWMLTYSTDGIRWHTELHTVRDSIIDAIDAVLADDPSALYGVSQILTADIVDVLDGSVPDHTVRTDYWAGIE